MVAVPPEIPVTTPELSTVATDGSNDVQGVVGCGNNEPERVKVPPTHVLFVVAVMVGKLLT